MFWIVGVKFIFGKENIHQNNNVHLVGNLPPSLNNRIRDQFGPVFAKLLNILNQFCSRKRCLIMLVLYLLLYQVLPLKKRLVEEILLPRENNMKLMLIKCSTPLLLQKKPCFTINLWQIKMKYIFGELKDLRRLILIPNCMVNCTVETVLLSYSNI